VKAAGVHFIDTAIRAGRALGAAPPPELPTTPGREVAGVIDMVGEGVDPAWAGKRVAAHLGATGSGGYAELAVADVAALHELPDGLDDGAAVALLGTGRMTIGLLEIAQLRPADVVLVTSAAGGIGTLLVQAARTIGATVVGVAGGPDKVKQVLESGATVAADYTDEAWPQTVRRALDGGGVTVAFDGVGGQAGRAAFDLLVPGGRHILFGMSSGEPTRFTSGDLFVRGLSATVALGARMANLPGGLRALEDKAFAEGASGSLVPAVQSFPLQDAARAHAALETRQTSGKVVLIP
jgi:NADPH2:quinone reductase